MISRQRIKNTLMRMSQERVHALGWNTIMSVDSNVAIARSYPQEIQYSGRLTIEANVIGSAACADEAPEKLSKYLYAVMYADVVHRLHIIKDIANHGTQQQTIDELYRLIRDLT